MNPNRDREERIFDAARKIASPEKQADYLTQTCGDDPALRKRVEAMLEADAAAGAFFETQDVSACTVRLATDLQPVTEQSGDRIGRYKLLQQIGEGGMGVVYMAEQEEPVRRRVALKIIKLGMDTRQVVARFEAERQALAMMDHPNIAKVLDAGATDSGRPYFVMELVRGVPITEYCDKNHLPTRERLDLLIQVCHAIQHAHQKGVIHRDLKPSNILVTLHDGVPLPMVIDFGIAKATNQKLTEKTLFTNYAQLIGTPAYMSPEQAEMSKLDVDTRTDIYALGVLLYELLTATTPFPAKELLSLGYGEMQRIIAEKEPLRPSTRLSTMANEERTIIAKNRSMEASALEKLFRGDLDWIVMKCLEKDRTRRYETANGLAADLKRHLNNEPVVARPPSQLYKIQKFARRNKAAFAAAACVTVALVAGLSLATIGLVQARLQRNQAFGAQQRAENARANEVQQRKRADELGRFAEEQRRRAEEGKQRAERSELVARQRAYASDINLAQQALATGDFGRAHSLVNDSADKQLRGWEWRYLWQQTRSEALSTLYAVPAWISGVEASSDGRWLAITESYGHTVMIRLWDRASGSTAAELQCPEVNAAPVFGPVSSILAYFGQLASQTNVYGVVVRDLQTRRQIAELPTGFVAGMAFSSDEKILVTCAYDRMVTRWQFPEGHKLSTFSFKEFPGFRSGGIQFVATRDTRIAVVGDFGGHRYAIDLKAGKELWRTKGAADELFSMALSPDDRVIASGPGFKGGPLTLFDAASGRELGRLEGHRNAVSKLVFWPDGRRLASASHDQTIRVWDIHDPANVPPPRVLRGHKNEVWGLALLPDGKSLVSGSKDGEVCLWDTGPDLREPQTSRLSSSNLTFWSFAPDSRSMVAADLEARELVEWRGATAAAQRTPMAFEPGAVRACWSQDGRWLAIGATNGLVQLWEFPVKTLRAQFSTGTNPVAPLQFHRDTRQLALVVGPRFETFEIWGFDLAQKSARKSLSRLIPSDLDIFDVANERVAHFELAPDLSQILAQAESADRKESRILLWSPADDQRRELGQLFVVAGVAFSPDGTLVAASSITGITKVWDARTGQEMARLTGFKNASHAVAFTPDGKRLAVGGGGDGLWRLWDAKTWRELITLTIEGETFSIMRFSPDGNALGAKIDSVAYTGAYGYWQCWRAPSWEEIAMAEAKEKPESKSP